MGTGSHRPQWEAAKGRPDVTGGIKHARSLKSHTKLKYRDPQRAVNRKLLTAAAVEKFSSDGEKLDKLSSESKPGSIDGIKLPIKLDSGDLVSESDGESEGGSDDSEEENLRNELQRLTKRKALRAQKEESNRPVSSWRSEAVFNRKVGPKRAKGSFLDKHSECVFRREWNPPPGSKKGEYNDDTAKLIFGIVHSLRNMTRKLTESDQFLTYSTSQYKLHYFESPSNLKMVLLTDPKVPSAVTALQQIYATLYVEYVVKNPLSPIEHKGGEGIENEIFTMGLDALVQSLPGFT